MRKPPANNAFNPDAGISVVLFSFQPPAPRWLRPTLAEYKMMKSILLIAVILCCPMICEAADLNELYASDYDAFWTIWNKAETRAKKCNNYDETAKFISEALTTLINAEVTEANSKAIENITFKKPKCLLEALLRLKAEEREIALSKFLVKPIFNNPSAIKVSLKKLWNEKKYKAIRDEYQNIEKTSQQGHRADRE